MGYQCGTREGLKFPLLPPTNSHSWGTRRTRYRTRSPHHSHALFRFTVVFSICCDCETLRLLCSNVHVHKIPRLITTTLPFGVAFAVLRNVSLTAPMCFRHWHFLQYLRPAGRLTFTMFCIACPVILMISYYLTYTSACFVSRPWLPLLPAEKK